MASGRGSTRRRLFPPEEEDSGTKFCSLCGKKHFQLSLPRSWKSESAQLLARSLHVGINSYVCCPCRDDITRLVHDPDHKPRWAKERNVTCCMPGCNETVFAQYKNITQANLLRIVHTINPGEGSLALPTPAPLCKAHYHLVYNELQPTQTRCVTCSSDLRKSITRVCPAPSHIQEYLAENTGYEGEITSVTKVCNACYKAHLNILKIQKKETTTSTDSDLIVIIQKLESEVVPPAEIQDMVTATNQALKKTIIHVANNILQHEAILLPVVHEYYSAKVSECLATAHLEGERDEVTARWILSNLEVCLGNHLRYTCKIRKCGTLLYRNNGDLLKSLTLALHKDRNMKTSSPEHCHHSEKPVQEEHNKYLDYVNSCMHKQISRVLADDVTNPFQSHTFDIERAISNIDESLWSVVVSLTRSVSERRGTSVITDHTSSAYHAKRIRRFFCLCCLMFCTDNRCSLPLHNLVTDVIESQGGTGMFVKLLNKLGACASTDTLARSIQHYVSEREKRGPENDCLPTTLTIVSADNIDFMHSYSKVFCGNQASSWHGTTVQAVQPLPSQVEDSAVLIQRSGTQAHSEFDLHTGGPSRVIREGEMVQNTMNSTSQLRDYWQHNTRKRQSHLRSPCSSPSTGISPIRKIQRRARTGTEFSSLDKTEFHFHRPTRHQRPTLNMTLEDFKVTATEDEALDQLWEGICVYMYQKHITTTESPGFVFLNIKDYFKAHKVAQTEKSNVTYLRVLDAVSDNKDTMMEVLQDLHRQFITNHGKKYLVVEGDAKLYEILQSLKYEYGNELDWLIVFPGDWHTLKNFQHALMKAYFDVGLKDLAKSSGYPVAAIQVSSQFKRTHAFILEAWEALFKAFIEKHIESDCSTGDFTQRVLSMMQSASSDTCIEDQIIQLQQFFLSQDYCNIFGSFLDKLSEADATCKFWVQFVCRDAVAYLGLYLAIRGGNWDMRMGSLKLMAPVFSAFDHFTYKKVIAQHISDVHGLPSAVTEFFSKGGFVVSLTGRPWSSVGIDEAHEMMINRALKTSIVHPSRDYITRVASYLPYRTRCIENLKCQLFPDDKQSNMQPPTSFESKNTNDRKAIGNVTANIALIKTCGVLTLEERDRGLQSFSKKKASPDQQHDLLKFFDIGTEEFTKYINYYILHESSTSVPQRKKRLATFAEKKVSKTKVNQMEKDRRLVQKCLHKRLKWSKQTGTPVDILGEQYIELPLAIATNDGEPLKGQKSYTTKAIQNRYQKVSPPIISNSLPTGWIPDCCILEGMFLINTTPLGSHKTFNDYGRFLIQRYIVPQYSRVCNQVHILFDQPGRLASTPKYFEQKRRDKLAKVSSGHTCDTFTGQDPIPSKWRENIINCRVCKRSLVHFLTQYFLQNISRYIPTDGTLVVAGGFQGEIQDTAWYVTGNNKPEPEPAYTCSAEESDTRIWLHVKASNAQKVLVMSPDTDVYHIALTQTQKDVIVQINLYCSKQLQFLHLSHLKTALKNDPDLSTVPEDFLPKIFQVLYVCTGCDYISFFRGIGKATFLRYFYQYAHLISSGKEGACGTLADTDLSNAQMDSGYLSFLRLVGTVYFKKHNTGFSTPNPVTHFNSFHKPGTTPVEQHYHWLEDIRQTIWDRVQHETDMIPSNDALYLHWRRTCWVIDMWSQSCDSHMVLKPLTEYGWRLQDGELLYDWDSEENRAAVRQRVQTLTKGCHCKTGCKTARCSCKKSGKTCAEGCECVNCTNVICAAQGNDDNLYEVSIEESAIEDEQLLEEVEQTMEMVFGERYLEDEESDDDYTVT